MSPAVIASSIRLKPADGERKLESLVTEQLPECLRRVARLADDRVARLPRVLRHLPRAAPRGSKESPVEEPLWCIDSPRTWLRFGLLPGVICSPPVCNGRAEMRRVSIAACDELMTTMAAGYAQGSRANWGRTLTGFTVVTDHRRKYVMRVLRVRADRLSSGLGLHRRN